MILYLLYISFNIYLYIYKINIKNIIFKKDYKFIYFLNRDFTAFLFYNNYFISLNQFIIYFFLIIIFDDSYITI